MTKRFWVRRMSCEDKCLKCEEFAQWVRHTQFAGSHPFCEQHAVEEKDFLEEDSYKFWEKYEIPRVAQ